MDSDQVQSKKKELMFLALSRYFYKEGAEKIVNKAMERDSGPLPKHIDDPKTPLTFNRQFVLKVHYSWIAEVLVNHPPLVQDAILLTIDKSEAEKACQLMERELPLRRENRLMANFGLEHLIDTFELKHKMPIPYLPASPYNILLSMSKQDLVTLIDLIPMHAISSEIKKVVDKNKLIGIYSALSEVQQKYLKTCLHHKRHHGTKGIDLKIFDGNQNAFASFMHKFGLKQLSMLISGQDPDFLWYLSHILDIGRGKRLLEPLKEQLDQEAKNALWINICHAMKFLK